MLALIKKVQQQRSHENERRKDRRYVPSVSVVQKQPLKNMVSNEATGHPLLSNSCCPKKSSQKVWPKPCLNSGPRLLRQGTINVRQSMGGCVSNVFVRWDIFRMQCKVFSSRHFFYLFQLLIHQRTPTTVIFPGCSESHVVHPHMHSCVSDRGEKGAQSLILSLGLKGIDITFKVDP